MMKLELNDKEYEIVIEKKNIKNLYLRFKEDDIIYITCNKYMSKKSILDFINSNLNSLEKMALSYEKKKINDEKFYYLGKEYEVVRTTNKEVIFGDSKIFIGKNIDIEKWLMKEAKKILSERLIYMMQYFPELKTPSLTIRKMKTRWGVCNNKLYKVTLNSELVRKDYDLIDYVIVHELCHFYHADHSRNFWNKVSEYLPDYKQRRKRLKEN